MRVLTIGYGKNLFNESDFEHQRLNRCAGEVECLDAVIFTHKKDQLDRATTANNFTVHPTASLHKLTMIFDAIRIGHKIIGQKQIDVISAQDVFETGLVGWTLKFLHPGVSLQVQEHADVLASKHWRNERFSNRFWYWFAFMVLERADIIRVVSDRTKNFLIERLGPGKNIKKLPVVVDTSSFGAGQTTGVKNSDVFTFITVARFVPQKNFPLMLNAFAKAYEDCPKIRLRIFGSGPLEADIKKQIVSLSLTEVVELCGWTDDVAGEMSRAHAYLLTSNYEGWARVLIEAMLQKLPVVTTDVGCVHEVVKDGEHGLVVPVDSAEELTEAIRKISTDNELYRTFISNLEEIDLASIPGTNIDEYSSLWVKTLQ